MAALPWLAGARGQLALIVLEGLLGLWLLCGLSKPLAWLTAVSAFATLGGASLYLLMIGQASCGCFGSVPVHPGQSLALDLALLVGLGLFRPPLASDPSAERLLRWLARGAVGVAAFAAAVVLAGCLWFGSLPEALAYLRDERLTLSPSVLDFGQGANGESRLATVSVLNRTDRPVRIVGGTTDCSCATTKDLPVTIPPHERRAVTVRLMFPRTSGGLVSRAAWLMTDDPEERFLTLRLVGRVVQGGERGPGTVTARGRPGGDVSDAR